MSEYDYLIVGAGLYGSTFARLMADAGKNVLVIDKRDHVGGNVYTENIDGIEVHKYGAHIFHTNNSEVWAFANRFAKFNDFINVVKANYKGEIYSLPFNMHTFNEMWGSVTPDEVRAIITAEIIKSQVEYPSNLEEQAISMVGRDIYEKLVRGYTMKQWGRECRELPAFIIKRLPLRFTYDNNYFNAKYQGVPVNGYTKMVEKMLEGIDVRLGVDYLKHKDDLAKIAGRILFTGAMDAFYDKKYGNLEYRYVRFATERLDMPDYQGHAVVTYTDRDTAWTRIIEHKWFTFGRDATGNEINHTIISKEFSEESCIGAEPYYPINDEKNNSLYEKYNRLAELEDKVIFGGRLADYKYYDMDQVIEMAMKTASSEIESQLTN